MTLTGDAARITDAVQARMERGWIDGDPATITIRPMMTRYRSYIVHFLRSAVGHKESEARADVLVGRVMRLIKGRLTANVLRDELARLQDAARHEGFDFRAIYAVAARQCAGFHMDLEDVMSERPAIAA